MLVVQLVTLEASFTILLRLPHLSFLDRQFVLDIVKSLLLNKVGARTTYNLHNAYGICHLSLNFQLLDFAYIFYRFEYNKNNTKITKISFCNHFCVDPIILIDAFTSEKYSKK